jgi:hypothetical protein
MLLPLQKPEASSASKTTQKTVILDPTVTKIETLSLEDPNFFDEISKIIIRVNSEYRQNTWRGMPLEVEDALENKLKARMALEVDPSLESFYDNIHKIWTESERMLSEGSIPRSQIKDLIHAKLLEAILKLDPKNTEFVRNARKVVDLAESCHQTEAQVRRMEYRIYYMIERELNSHTPPDENSINTLQSHLDAAYTYFSTPELTTQLENLMKSKKLQMKRG